MSYKKVTTLEYLVSYHQYNVATPDLNVPQLDHSYEYLKQNIGINI